MQLDGFEPVRHKTCVTAGDLRGKQLWLFRLPKDVSIEELNGQKITIPEAEGAEMASVETETSNVVLRKAYNVEKDTFHVLLADDHAPLKLGPRFEGLISVQQLPKSGAGTEPVQRIVPYEPVPQTNELTVRFMPIGSTTDMAELRSTIAERPSASSPATTKHKKSKKKHETESAAEVPATPARSRHAAEVPATPARSRHAEAEPGTAIKDKKKKKRKSVEPEKEKEEQSTKKKKKSKPTEA